MPATIICKAVIAVIVITLAAGLLLLYFRSRNITRSEMRARIKKIRLLSVWAIIFALVLGGIFAVANHVKAKDYATAVISLNYSEASQAQNANGTHYNMSEITCDEVVAKAIALGGFEGVSVSELKSCLSVYPQVEGNAYDESGYQFSTEFVLEYNASAKTDHLNAENAVLLVASAYKEYFMDKYADNFQMEKVSESTEFEDLEYMDIVLYLQKESSKVLNYMYGLEYKNSSFVGSNGATFSSIAAKLYQIDDMQIDENLRSYILQNGIAKDAESYVERLTYENRQLAFDKECSAASFRICNEAISMYSEEMTRIVLVPTWDEDGKYYMGRTKVGIDDLSVDATDYSNDEAGYAKTIQNNELVAEKLSGVSSQASNEEVEAMIRSISESIDKFAAEATVLSREYSAYRLNQCISVSVAGYSLLLEIEHILIVMLAAYAAVLLVSFAKHLPKRKA